MSQETCLMQAYPPRIVTSEQTELESLNRLSREGVLRMLVFIRDHPLADSLKGVPSEYHSMLQQRRGVVMTALFAKLAATRDTVRKRLSISQSPC